MRWLFLLVITVYSFASLQSENIQSQAAYGNKVVQERDLGAGGEERWKGEDFSKEVILNYYQYFASKKRPEYTGVPVRMVMAFQEVNATNQEHTTSEGNVTVEGYCLIDKDVPVGKQPAAIAPLCRTNIGYIRIFANLIPNNRLASLFVDPVYIVYKGHRFKVLSSRVTNEARTSYNVATFVNDRKLAHIALKSAQYSADEIKTASNEYLRELERSRTETKVSYVSVPAGSDGNNTITYPMPVQENITHPPRASDYIAKAAINIAATTAKAAAQIFEKDLPYLYLIKKGTKIYVDMVVDKKEMK